jgi:NitT/TauT family transport system substrate-binding protein
MKRACLILCACVLAACGARTKGTEVRLALQPPSTNNYPSYLAQWLGFYEQERLHVTISQIAGASKVLEALAGGSADVGGGVYEQTIQMAAEGREIVSFISLIRSPNFAIVAAPASGVKSLAGLRGKIAGVSSVGSPSQFYLNYVLQAAGVAPGEVSTANIGMGATAVSAIEHRQVDAGTLFGSAVTTLQARQPDLVILADTRTPEGLKATFGVDDYPASCLLATGAWLKSNPEAARKIGRAVLRSLTWIREHSAEEILARVPAEFHAGDSAAELAAIRMAKPMYSLDGRIHEESAEAVQRVLSQSLEKVRSAHIDLSRTYTNEFLQ